MGAYGERADRGHAAPGIRTPGIGVNQLTSHTGSYVTLCRCVAIRRVCSGQSPLVGYSAYFADIRHNS